MDSNVNNAGGSFDGDLRHNPNAEQASFAMPHQPTSEQGGWQTAEQGTREMVQNNNAMASQQPISGAPQPHNPMPVSPLQNTTSMPASSNPAVADDSDLIEKEWVNKAKSIVEKTRQDPYTENHEISKLKADYMQKRYGKQLKMEE